MTPSLSSPAHTHEVLGNRMIFHREFDAPRELVYRAWTEQLHLEMWWGPTGFRTTTESFGFRVDGQWIYTMHGPDGTDWPNRVRYSEIVPNERIAYRHDEGHDDDLHAFDVVVTFIDLGNNRTRIDMDLIFVDEATARKIVESAGAVAGHQQTMQRLEDFLPALHDRDVSTASGVFTITRDFAAPIELVWKAWTEADRMKQWFGPEGFSIPHCNVEAVVGGRWHLAMRDDSTGQDHWCGGVFQEIEAPHKLVYTDYFATPEGEMIDTADMGMPEYPSRNTVTIIFESIAPNKTRMLLTSDTPVTAAQKYGADFGWGSSLVKLHRLLAS